MVGSERRRPAVPGGSAMALRRGSTDGIDSTDSDYRRPTSDQRESSRKHVLVPVRFWVVGDDAPRRGDLRNLSAEGAFVEGEPLPVKTQLRIELPVRNGVELRNAEVVWIEQPELATRVRYVRGFGVRFLAGKSFSKP
jgi:hypothetical protein